MPLIELGLPLVSQDAVYRFGPLATVPYQVIMPLRPRLFTSLAKVVHTEGGSEPYAGGRRKVRMYGRKCVTLVPLYTHLEPDDDGRFRHVCRDGVLVPLGPALRILINVFERLGFLHMEEEE